MKKHIIIVVISIVETLACVSDSKAQGTAFTYQGVLSENGHAANGNYDLRFSLFEAFTDGIPIRSVLPKAPVAASNGLFNVILDFGSASLDGGGRWLEISVRTNGSTLVPTLLSPRQAVLPAPYAIQAASAAGLSGNPVVTGSVSFSPGSGAPFVVGSSAKVTNLNADLLDGLDSSAFAPALHPPNDCPDGCYWKLMGNTGTSAGGNFLGTTDDQPLEFKVNGQRVLRLEPADGSPNIIAGFSGNYSGWDENFKFPVGVTISGGGGFGAPNSASGGNVAAHYATIAEA